VRLLAPRLTPNLEDQGVYFVLPLLFHLSGMCGSTRRLRFRQHNFRIVGARKPPLHDRAVALEDGLAKRPLYDGGLDGLQRRSESGAEERNHFSAGNITPVAQFVAYYLRYSTKDSLRCKVQVCC
jgi:hypothetical protein